MEARRGHQEHKLWAVASDHMGAGNRTEVFCKKWPIPTIKDDEVINLRGSTGGNEGG